MTEEDWLRSAQVGPMVNYLGLRPRGLSRKLRLFAVACCRRVWHLLPDEASRRAVLVAERFADGLARRSELKAAYEEAGGDSLRSGYNPAGPVARANAPSGAYWAAQNAHTLAGQHDADGKPLGRYDRARSDAEERAQVELLRDVFANPFRPPPPLQEDVRSWNGGSVVALAQGIYEDRAFDQLPILADALEEAGCTSRAILDHLRGPGPHTRGCWALDQILPER
jgi:hypothetical protein